MCPNGSDKARTIVALSRPGVEGLAALDRRTGPAAAVRRDGRGEASVR